MADRNGFEYIIQKGDSLSNIAKKYFIADWEVLYFHDENAQFRKSNPDYNKIRVGDKLFIPSVFSLVTESGPESCAVKPGNMVFFDAHMHIQSNNCVPLTLQWGLTKRTVNIRLEGAREPLTILAGIGAKRMGQIGGYPSDIIASIYYGIDEKAPSIFWKKLCPAIPVIEWGSKVLTLDSGIKLLAQKSGETEEAFESKTHYYYTNNSVERIAVCHLMDMSYSHFWGRIGLPIYLPLENSGVYINDFISGGITVALGHSEPSAQFTSVTEATVLSAPLQGWAHLFPKKLPGDKFSFKEQYNNYMQTKISMPNSIHPTSESFILFSNDPAMRSLNAGLIQKEFIHIVEDLPKKEMQLFENYYQQKIRSINAAMANPLKLLPFYHFDPRRHVPKSRRTQILDNISGSHAFYRLSKEKSYLQLIPDSMLNDRAYLASIIDSLNDNTDAYNELFFHPSSKKGVFWGVKVYPRLGFAPDDFTLYPQLKEMFTECEMNNIPITSHCSRGPMCIADYVNYSRYGEKNHNAPKAVSENTIKYKEHEFWFADSFTSAANWEQVIKVCPDLKIDLAHFGGLDIWEMMGSIESFSGLFEDIEKKYKSNPDKLPKEEKLYGSEGGKIEQLANLYFTWVQRTAILVQSSKNVYTDLACFAMADKSKKGKNGASKMELIAKNLAYLITTYPKLKERIIIGSDWYMAEYGGTEGVGIYFARMFEMLRMVSELVNPQFDAWHQFTVINPLNFLGLWIDGGCIDVEMCEKYVKRLPIWLNNKDLIKYCKKILSKEKIDIAGRRQIDFLKGISKIQTANEMIGENGELLISE
ncbi:MAG: LysM peptidoglycan-binding domain-containing protein [Fibrobacter sp.]|nr:LysM peptidoglycan-binding domain-containing protein [Fibrobacter sp.]